MTKSKKGSGNGKQNSHNQNKNKNKKNNGDKTKKKQQVATQSVVAPTVAAVEKTVVADVPEVEPKHVDPLAELLAEEAKNGGKSKKKKKQKKNAPPPKKAGETKQQYEARINGGTSDDVFTRPSGGKLLDLGDFEEEEPEVQEPEDTDYSDTANERKREYKQGGYHPVILGELYNERYRVVHKLGWGYFSTVWLVWDYEGECFQAMKVQKSAEHYREAAFDEIKLLSQIMGADPEKKMCCARMTDSFEHKGPHGRHVCMLFDLLGENLLSLIERYENRGVPIPIVKSIARETLIGLYHLHSIDIIHTDIKPENVLLSSPKHKFHRMMRNYKPPPMGERPSLMERDPTMMTKSQKRRYFQKMKKMRESGAADPEEEEKQKARVAAPEESAEEKNGEHKAGEDEEDLDSETDDEWEVERFHHCCLADFGNSCWTHTQFTDEVQTRQYRAPEVLIGDPYSCPIDLWSAACMFFELLTGEFLFDPKVNPDYSREEDHLALITELLGDLPESMRCGQGKYRPQFFRSNGEFRHINDLRFWPLSSVLHEKYRFSRKKSQEIANFLLPMLNPDPEERATAEEMLTLFEEWFEVQEDDYSPLCYTTAGDELEDDEEDVTEDLDEYFDDDVEEEEEEEEEGSEGDAEHGQEVAADGATGTLSEVNKNTAAKKSKQHRAHRPPRHSGSRSQEQSQEADDASAWLAANPILHPDHLESYGLTIMDIKNVLDGQSLDDDEKEDAAALIIKMLESYDGEREERRSGRTMD